MSNRLASEQSPYLLQHAQNPVDWFPWGAEAFERAVNENKPLLISIGYAACHWCHVMEKESFEDKHTAAYMNEHFICVKVDREEHPDVDQFYMDAVQAISGSGGWPLNVFATPEKVPFYGGTYFPPRPAFNRPSWMQVLQRMSEVWMHQQKDVQEQTQQMMAHLQQIARIQLQPADVMTRDDCTTIFQKLNRQADHSFGGFGSAPKFPSGMCIQFLLEHYYYFKNEEALALARLCLDAMMKGGIYDQLGGGFSRYATDAKWLVPHFEKMLYDNAILVSVYASAFQLTEDEGYQKVVEETIAFVQRELRHPNGIFYSALDADSEGKEGKFYTWDWEDWLNVVDDEAVASFFGVSPEGNWEGTNILHTADREGIAERFSLTEQHLDDRLVQAKETLLEARSKRERPLTDDKSLLSWNALMNLALARSAAIFQRADWQEAAVSHMEKMLQLFVVEDGVYHVWKDGMPRIAAKLDDYVYLIRALIELSSLTGYNGYILKAKQLLEGVWKDFLVEAGEFFYYSPASYTDIPLRKQDVVDAVLPSANAVLAECLWVLGTVFECESWLQQASQVLSKIKPLCLEHPYSAGYWSCLLQREVFGIKTVVCSGAGGKTLVGNLKKLFLPGCYCFAFEKEISEVPISKDKLIPDQTLIFVCTQSACLPPVSTIEESLRLISTTE